MTRNHFAYKIGQSLTFRAIKDWLFRLYWDSTETLLRLHWGSTEPLKTLLLKLTRDSTQTKMRLLRTCKIFWASTKSLFKTASVEPDETLLWLWWGCTARRSPKKESTHIISFYVKMSEIDCDFPLGRREDFPNAILIGWIQIWEWRGSYCTIYCLDQASTCIWNRDKWDYFETVTNWPNTFASLLIGMELITDPALARVTAQSVETLVFAAMFGRTWAFVVFCNVMNIFRAFERTFGCLVCKMTLIWWFE